MTFEEVNKKLRGSAEYIIKEARIRAQYDGFDRAYNWGKRLLSNLVGWWGQDNDLRDSSVYTLVMDHLADECWKGEKAGRKDVVWYRRRMGAAMA